MRRNVPQTPLLALLRALTPEQRDEFASEAGTPVSYLYALATCARASPRVGLAKRIADASAVLARRYDTPAITIEQIAEMCPCAS